MVLPVVLLMMMAICIGPTFLVRRSRPVLESSLALRGGSAHSPSGKIVECHDTSAQTCLCAVDDGKEETPLVAQPREIVDPKMKRSCNETCAPDHCLAGAVIDKSS